jgi:hypothetical protein
MIASAFDTLVAAESAHGAAVAHLAALQAEESWWYQFCDDLPRDLAVNLGDAEAAAAATFEAVQVADEAAWADYQEYTYLDWCEHWEEAAA